MHKIISFQEALELSNDSSKRHLLIGNGFSIACRKDIFRYDSLFEKADLKKTAPNVEKMFQLLGTQDFEVVMKHFRYAINILKIYQPTNTKLIEDLQNDSNELKIILVNAIASSHPAHPSEILEEEYNSCKNFLRNFKNFYTLNYDLLLYWTFMHYQDGQLTSDDGFRTPDTGNSDFVSWDIEKTDWQNLFYLHGALHVFDSGSELQKFTWINTGVRLIEQIRNALDNDKFPLFVSEGTSSEKMDKIMHSNYLSRGMRSFSHIGGSLFIHGHSLADNDNHILNLIPKSKIKRLFVSLYGNLSTKANKAIVGAAESIVRKRKGNKVLELFFYNSESAHVWK
jgi:hypothetical protein